MRNFIFIALAVSCFMNSAYANTFEKNWSKAIENCSLKKFDEAEKQFTFAIKELELQNDDNHPHVYVDRGRLYMLQNRYSDALVDLNKALESPKLEGSDKLRALISRNATHMNLCMEKEAWSDYEEYKKLNSSFPKNEFRKDKVIIRNAPDSKCYREIIKAFSIACGICESESDIEFHPSGIILIKRKKCNCKDMKAYNITDAVDDCKYYCDKMVLAANIFCTGTFKTIKCQGVCLAAVDYIKDGCYHCCRNGNFYNDCVKPFSDILGKMDSKICAPDWD